MKIVFMGTPEFAVPSLKILIDNAYDVVGVITSTDKYGGRGKKKLLESAVKRYAKSVGLHILQPPRLKRIEFLDELRALNADLQVIVAFRMLPEVVWNMPPQGSINLHASLLPNYRGAAPINWAIINGELETGLTTFKLKHEIDTGDLIHQLKVPIEPNDTAGDLHDRMMGLGAELVLKTVGEIAAGEVVERPQVENDISHAPKIYHEDCKIDFNRTVQEVHNFIRGLSPYPCAWAVLDALQLNVIRTEIVQDRAVPDNSIQPGTIDLSLKGRMHIACTDGYLNILEAQLAGRKRMKMKDLLNGYSPHSPELT